MEMISIQNISFSYNDHTVLTDISHDLHRGTFIAVMGPNGSGKTTLLRLIDGILKPTQGIIKLMDKPLGKYRRDMLAREMAYLPQMQMNVFPATVFDTVLLGRKPYIQWNPGNGDRELVSSLLVKLGLDEIAFKDINRLSSGQRQRVFIARALAQEPGVILLDEPTANLDLQHQHEVMALLQHLRSTGITIIVAIHDINLALKYCTEFMLLDEGKLVAIGDHKIINKELIELIYKVKVRVIKEEGETFIVPIKPV
jgi:iron complex transport system ATP-binding protein